MMDLIDILERSLTPAEIVELLDNTYINPQALEEYAIENMICPECYCMLEIHKLKENMGEHFGFPCSKSINELVCDSCGWSLDC